MKTTEHGDRVAKLRRKLADRFSCCGQASLIRRGMKMNLELFGFTKLALAS